MHTTSLTVEFEIDSMILFLTHILKYTNPLWLASFQTPEFAYLLQYCTVGFEIGFNSPLMASLITDPCTRLSPCYAIGVISTASRDGDNIMPEDCFGLCRRFIHSLKNTKNISHIQNHNSESYLKTSQRHFQTVFPILLQHDHRDDVAHCSKRQSSSEPSHQWDQHQPAELKCLWMPFIDTRCGSINNRRSKAGIH